MIDKESRFLRRGPRPTTRTARKPRRLRRGDPLLPRTPPAKSSHSESSSPPTPIPGDDPRLGSTIDGKYRILDVVGQGGMATVYRAWHLLLRKEVALKFIHPEAAENKGFRECFSREARVATELVHKHLVPTREFGETVDGQFYILMDLCRGRTLAQLLRDEGPLQPERAARLVIQLLDALAEVHRMGTVHCDVKPENVMVDDEEFVRVLDFGLASLGRYDLRRQPLPEEAPSSRIVGTPRYMSPEQALGLDCDHRTDIYSAGLLLYELLVGRLPCDGSNSTELVRQRIVDDVPPPAALEEGIELPTALLAPLMKALEREQDSRWQSASAFQLALDGYLTGEAVEVSVPLGSDAFEHKGRIALRGSDSLTKAYRVRHLTHELEGVCWILSPEESSPRVLSAFTAQVEIARRVHHPALAQGCEAGAYSGQRLYAFSPWTAGVPLSERVLDGPLSEAETIAIVRPLIEALAKAHEFGVSHGSLDMSLIVLTPNGPVLHGLGVVPAAEPGTCSPRRDVRELALLCLQLLTGVEQDELAPEGLVAIAHECSSTALVEVCEEARGEDGFPHAGAFLEALARHDRRFRSGGIQLRRRHAFQFAAAALGVALLWLSSSSSASDIPTTAPASPLATAPRAEATPAANPEPPPAAAVDFNYLLRLSGEVETGAREAHAVRARVREGAHDVPPERLRLADRAFTVARLLREVELDPQASVSELLRAQAHMEAQRAAWREAVTALEYARAGVDNTREARTRLQRLARKIERARQEAIALRQRALGHLADVHLEAEFAQAQQAMDRAQALRPPSPDEIQAQEVDSTYRLLKEQLDEWLSARASFHRVAGTARELNAVKTILARVSGAVVRQNVGELESYLTSKEDVAYFRTLFQRAERLRFSVGQPEISRDEALVNITELSFVDTWQERRVSLAEHSFRLSKASGQWKVSQVQRPR